MMTADAAFSTYFAQTAGEAAIGIYVAAPHVSGEAYDEFLRTWRQEIDEAGPTGGFHAHGYDAANLLLDAVEAVATERDDGTLIIGRGALREALARVDNYAGLTGSLTCREESPYAGDCATGEALAIFQLTGSEVHEGNWPPPRRLDSGHGWGGIDGSGESGRPCGFRLERGCLRFLSPPSTPRAQRKAS